MVKCDKTLRIEGKTMVQDKVCIFDTSSLVYIYMHSRRSDAHTLLHKYKRELNLEYFLAANDLAKDLIGPLQTKYFTKISALFKLEKSPRDDFFNEIKQVALDNNYISYDDVRDEKLTDLDIVRLAVELQEQDKKVLIVTDDEGIHKLVNEFEFDEAPEILYTHLFFLKMMPLISDENDKKGAQYNIQDSYYYLNSYLKKSDRYLPYEKVINTSIEILSRSYKEDDKKKAIYKKKITSYIENGKESNEIKDLKPILEIMRKKRIDPDFCTETACLQLISKLRGILGIDNEIVQIIFSLVQQELASYHLELANRDHKELNLVGSLAHIRAAVQSLAFLSEEESELEKSLDELLFIEALLLLELGSEEEALLIIEQSLKGELKTNKELKNIAESLLVIFGKKVGRISEESTEFLLELVKEASTIPNQKLVKIILSSIINEERISIKQKKKASEEIIHLLNLRMLLKENPIVEKAKTILGKEIIDRTSEKPDMFNLKKIKEDFEGKIAETYRGPWEIAEIRNKKKSTWIYAWNEKLKSLWALEILGEYPSELDKAKTITFLSGNILSFKNYMPIEDIKYRQRITFEENPVFVIDEKRAFSIW